MHYQERRRREQRNPKIVHSKTKSDHKKGDPHIHRVASEAIRPLRNQLWRGLPGNRVLTCALEQNARRGNKAHPAGDNENGCREAKPPGKHERQWHSLTLNNHSQNNRPQKNQRRRESNPCTVFTRNGHALTSLAWSPHRGIWSVRPPVGRCESPRHRFPRCFGSHERAPSSLLAPGLLNQDQGSPSRSARRAS